MSSSESLLGTVSRSAPASDRLPSTSSGAIRGLIATLPILASAAAAVLPAATAALSASTCLHVILNDVLKEILVQVLGLVDLPALTLQRGDESTEMVPRASYQVLVHP